MLPFIIGIFFILHGLVHLLWFVVPWRITTVNGLPYSTRVLGQRFDVGDTGIRIVGLLWLAATLGWGIAGGGLMLRAPWWQGWTMAAALFSSVLCILGLPVAKYGLLINIIILAFMFLNAQFHWLASSRP